MTVTDLLRSARCGCRMAMVEMAEAGFFECPTVCTIPLCSRCRRIKVRGRR